MNKENTSTRFVLMEKKPLRICVTTTGLTYNAKKCKTIEELGILYISGKVIYPINVDVWNLDVVDFYIALTEIGEEIGLVSKEICITISE